MPLNTDLTMIDRGYSGFYGHHRKYGVFGVFLKMVQADLIAPGSVLNVEHIDRLGREKPLTALETCLALFNADITIRTEEPAPVVRYNKKLGQ